MKFSLSLLLAAWILFAFAGCGDMISSLRRDAREADAEANNDRDDADTTVQSARARTVHGLSANNVSDYQAPTSRIYGRKPAARAAALEEEGDGQAEEALHRVTRDDFVDKVASENSLWDGQGQNNYLFSNNRRRETGDVITADVEKELRREIQYQLWMNLPPEQRRLRKPASAQAAADSVTNAAAGAAKDAAGNAAADAAKKSGAEKSAEAKAKDVAEEAAKQNLASNGKEDDVIKMEVVESLGNGLMRLLGQKRVVYRGVSKIVEIAALVNNKDIDDGNHTKSSTFLDMKAQVIQ
jgi:flagellar basal body L-ring protein FlgH